MKRVAGIILLATLLIASQTLLAKSIKGRVTGNQTPLRGVVVTDGRNFAVTGNKGEYTLDCAGDARFVYISIPSGYSVPQSGNTPAFYIPLAEIRKSYDFVLDKKSQDDTRHGFIAIADPQIYAAKEFPLLQEAAVDIKRTVESYKVPFHGVCCGDIVSYDHGLYPRYKEIIAGTGLQFFNVMGNHDMVNNGRSFETTFGKYEESFGPAYYSMNVGNIHYVFLDDNFYVGREYFYIGYLDEKQFAWLEKDLSYIKEGSTVVIVLHIPTTTSEGDRKKFSYTEAGATMANKTALYKMLSPYKAHIISGHTHTAANQQVNANIFEYNLPALSGAWWQGSLCTDGAPKGYGVFIADGNEITWHYRSTGEKESYQMRLYTGRDDNSFNGYVVANIWNSDPSWRVELYEDGVSKGSMERFSAYDPDAKKMYSDREKLEHKWIYPSVSDHFYRAKLNPQARKVEVVAVDRYGREYRESLPQFYDVVVIGGGTSGTTAGIKAARLGARTLIAEEFEWLGGMLTSAGVSAFDGNYKLKGGFWGEFRDSLSSHYGSENALKTGWVSNILFEPSAGAKILKNIASREKNLEVKFHTTASNFTREDGIWKVSLNVNGKKESVEARVLIDATELGDVAARLGIGYQIGMDSRSVTGEDMAQEKENDIIQDLTYVMILKEYDRDMTIKQPENYNPSLFYCSTICEKCKNPKEKQRLWSPEKMITYGKLPNGKYMINWPIEGNDYYTNIIELSPEQREIELAKAKEHSLSFLYYIQTELGFNKLSLADDEYPTADKLPFIPYHRESRRINGVVRFSANHISEPYIQPEKLYRTSVAVGDYPVDHHHTRYTGWAELPDLHFHPVPSYGLPLGVMIPQGREGLIVAEKSISVSNLANGTTRLQPVVLQIGEAAGTLAALAVKDSLDVAEVNVRDVQRSLLASDGYLMPYLDLPAAHQHFKAIQRIGVTGIIKGKGMNKGWENQTWFMTDSLITARTIAGGLSEVYPQFSAEEYGDKPVTLTELCSMISKIQTTNSSDGTTPASIVKTLSKEWSGMGLTTFNPARALNRLECAVVIDKILDPFSNVRIDIKGNYLK